MKRILLIIFVLASLRLQAQEGLLDLPASTSSADVDMNGLRLNPEWKCQKTSTCNKSPRLPDATICDHERGTAVPSRCRTQSSTDDVPTAFFKKTICSLAPSLLHGHVNFNEPVVLTGEITWDGHSDDFDLDLILATTDGKLATSHNSRPDTIALELDSRETVDRFTTVDGWWRDFKTRLADRAQVAHVGNLFDAKYQRNAVAIGLLGVDCEHSCHSELHPIYALAFLASDTKPSKEHWIVLARNFGDEGFCSHLQHPLQSASASPLLHVLIPKEAIGMKAWGKFIRTSGAANPVKLTAIDAVGIDVAFPLAATQVRQVFLGEIWITGPSTLVPIARSASRVSGPSEKEEGSETLLHTLISSMPTGALRSLKAQRLAEAHPPITATVENASPMSLDQYAWTKAHVSSALHTAPTPDGDTQQEQRDLDFWRGICEAYGNSLPVQQLQPACAPEALTISPGQ